MTGDELARALAGLDGEHAAEFAPAIEWLVEHPAAARPALIRVVEAGGSDAGMRRAIEALGRIGDPGDVALLARQLAGAIGSFATAAARGLALHRDPAATDALIEAARGGTDDAALAATAALGERREPRARETLEALLDHADDRIRYRAAVGLHRTGSSSERLRARLAVETDDEVRAAIERVLAGAAP